MVKKIYYILGGPGSGKGTLCGDLKKNFPITQISTGDLLRACVASGSEEGKRLKAIMDAGQLVDQETVLKLLNEAVAKAETEIVLLDGFPRTVAQLEAFEALGVRAEKGIYLNCGEETMVARIQKRARESAPGQVRSDDNVEAARKRYATYIRESAPVMEVLKKYGRCVEINAERSIPEVYNDVRVIFEEK